MTPLVLAAEAGAEAAHGGAEHGPAAVIMHHVSDGYHWEVPGGASGFSQTIDLRGLFGQWWKGEVLGIPVDLTPTKSVLMLWLGAVVLLAVALWAVRGRGAVPKGRLQNVVEALFLFVRDEIAVKNIGHHSERYLPYLATAFFFILSMNLLGIIPYLGSATGNVNVTVVLALCTFVLTQVAGMRAHGVVGYWKQLVPHGVPVWLYPIMIPVEVLGLFTKPFALTVRLFANMVAGHIVIFFLLALIFFLHSYAVAPLSVAFAFGIFLLEIFVALLQAYIFTMLSGLFIGMASHGH